MSAREEAQKKLVEFLLEHREKFNALYGVIEGLKPMGYGKVRIISFGIARCLNAEIVIYKENNISINGSGALVSKYCGHFTSVEQVIQRLSL